MPTIKGPVKIVHDGVIDPRLREFISLRPAVKPVPAVLSKPVVASKVIKK